jgi:Flp pilus assembly protein TadD
MSPLLRRWLPPTLLVLAVLAVYGQVLDHQFTAWDDHGYVDRNPYVLQGLSWTTIQWAFTSGSHSNYHPLTWISHMLDIELYARWAGGHAFTNLVLHTINTLLLWQLIRTLTGRVSVAFFVALLFAVHPLNVEAVANISQRKSVLSTCFGLLSILVYVGYVRRGAAWRYLLTLLLAALSLLSKALFVTLPGVLLLLDYWPLGRTPWRGYHGTAAIPSPCREIGWKQLAFEKLPFIALSLAISLLTMKFQKQTGAMNTAGVDLLTSVTGAVASYVFYLGKTVWPSGLAAFYPLPEHFPAYMLPSCLAILLAITVVCFWAHRKRPYLLVGWLWFCLVLVPMAGFVRVGGMAAADRYCYVPLIGLFLAIGITVANSVESAVKRRVRLQPIAIGVGGLASLGFATVAHRQVGFWRDTETSFNRILATQGPHDLFPALIGYDLFDRGEFERAIPYFRQSLAVMPSNDWVAANLGIALYCTGNSTEAEYWLRCALVRNRRQPGALNTLAKISDAKGDRAMAIDLYREVLQITPTFMEARLKIARLLQSEGRSVEALEQVTEGLKLYPSDENLRALEEEISRAIANPASAHSAAPGS